MRPLWNRVGTDPLTAVLCKGNKDAETHTGRRQPWKDEDKTCSYAATKKANHGWPAAMRSYRGKAFPGGFRTSLARRQLFHASGP